MEKKFVIDTEELSKLRNWIDDSNQSGTHYSGMSYEQGMSDLLDVLEGYQTVADITGG